MTTFHEYSPLPDVINSIRLLHIEPGWPDDGIYASLTVAPHRDEAPPYEALSYTWGSTDEQVPITVNGGVTTITRNLASALRALRQLPAAGDPGEHGIDILGPEHILHSKNRPWNGIARNRNEAGVFEGRRASAGGDNAAAPTLFWIDALCINQTDMDERTAQVKAMRHIYSAAEMVRIWLGDELLSPDGSPLLLTAVQPTSRFDRAVSHIRIAELGYMPVILTFLAQALRNAERVQKPGKDNAFVDLIGFPRKQSPEYSVLAAFFEQPWFRRVWIVQEAILAQKSTIRLGPWELDWEPFAQAVDILHMGSLDMKYDFQLRSFAGFRSREITSGVDLWPARYLADIRRFPGRTKHLLWLLNDSRTRKASNLADHVFAVLGMATEMTGSDDTGKILLAVDYKKPIAQVFRDATWFIMLSHKTLRPLTMAELTDERTVSDSPSWVPIWSQPRKAIQISQELFNASLGQPMNINFENAMWLDVSGYRLESVDGVSQELANLTAVNDIEVGLHYPPRQAEIDFINSAWALLRSSQGRGNETEIRGTLIAQSSQCLAPTYQSNEEILQAFIYTLVGNVDDESPNGKADGSDDVPNSARAWFQTHIPSFSREVSFFKKIQNFIKNAVYPWTGLPSQVGILRACSARRFFVTSSGYMGIGPASMMANDLVVVILGLPVPLVLRKTGPQDCYILVGECYVHGIMDGELVRWHQRMGEQASVFRLI
jgi:hypothetical protein